MNDRTQTTIAAIERTLELDASPERVWDALTEPDRLASWFPDAVEGMAADADGWGWLVWHEHGRYAIRTTTFEPKTRLVWRWARESDTALDAGPTTTVEWRLEPDGKGGTILHLREDGFHTEEAREQNVGGWKHELEELRRYLS